MKIICLVQIAFSSCDDAKVLSALYIIPYSARMTHHNNATHAVFIGTETVPQATWWNKTFHYYVFYHSVILYMYYNKNKWITRLCELTNYATAKNKLSTETTLILSHAG